ncbi:MAG TPA: Crp/Fnr family transcriptional regulator [Ferruginibacter sp.]|nr:Crp/Fnr family transcriptional regulator [Ferruginibacter sp.]HRO06142.1 Crp/Fnr family transcriptional regulator [Ferruginibacter sp.]HRO97340.1 Crp/Fnr family transcriptional regulator [Ferruginibacter sp.]HRP50545.1 Crp/Fnr family transcriptional regulator [Ferruginibacter sp.]
MIDLDLLFQWGAITKKVVAEEKVVEEDHPSYYYYQLLDGRLRAVNINEQGKEYLQYIVNPGETFAEIPLVIPTTFQITVIADVPSEIVKLPRDRFETLLTSQPHLQAELSKVLANRLRLKYIITKELCNHNPQHSILSLLEYLQNEGKHICKACNKVELTRQQIADMLGLRVETVIRAIRDLYDRELLVIQNGKVFYPARVKSS